MACWWTLRPACAKPGRSGLGCGLDPGRVLARVHGRRAVDAVAELAPHLDAVAEARRIEALELTNARSVRACPGAVALLRGLPWFAWAVVTSGTRRLARARLAAAGLPLPRLLITAEDVAVGKPDPAGYLRAAAGIGVPPGQSLVVEDAPPGVRAGRAAGMAVRGVTTTYAAAALAPATVVPTLAAVRVWPASAWIVLHLQP